MIANTVYAYCCEDISLIENYEQAVNDKTETWVCHHRKETDEEISRDELIRQRLYWNRPASELIFLTRSAHSKLHNYSSTWRIAVESTNKARKGKPRSAEHSANISKALKGKPKSQEHIKKLYKPIYQIDKITLAVIKKWDSMKEASQTLKINCGLLSSVCRHNRKSAGGFIWRYVS